MRSLAIASTVLLVASIATADSTDTAQANPATHGAVSGKPLAVAALAHRTQVDVLDAEVKDIGDEIRVALTDGHDWWAATADLPLFPSCGMGKCLTTTLDHATISEADGIAWIRFDLTFDLEHSDPDMRATDHPEHGTAVMGCTLPVHGEAPRCALVTPDPFETTSTTVHGTTVDIRGEHGTRSVAIAF